MKSWKTTVLGVVSALLAVLVGFGILTPEDSATANDAVVALIEQIGGIILTVTALLGLFSRDNDKTSEQVGAKE